MRNIFRANGDMRLAYSKDWMSTVSWSPMTTLLAGRNLRKFGFGVFCVWINRLNSVRFSNCMTWMFGISVLFEFKYLEFVVYILTMS